MGWDKGVDYTYMYAKITKHLSKSLASNKIGACYDAILLLQLRNGLRIGEAINAFLDFMKNKKTELYVRVEKRKDSKERLVVVPSELLNTNLSVCRELLDVDLSKLKSRVKVYAIITYNVNTHSLRYAFINHLLKSGVNPAFVSKIVGHKDLRILQNYVSEKESEVVLREYV